MIAWLRRFRPITISLSPNVFGQDLWLAFKLLFSPRKWFTGESVGELEAVFARDLRAAEAVGFDSGRSALLGLLNAFGIKAGDEVILQAYTCVVVPNAIRFAGAEPIYVDIAADTFNIDPTLIERAITPRTKAIIIQHTFGLPVDLNVILPLARRHGLTVIEDCAHALGATLGTSAGQQRIGTLGDGAFFSFGRDKVISSVFGGIAMVRDRGVGERLRRYQQALPMPSRRWVAQQLLHPLLFALIIPLYFWQIGKVLLVLFQKLELLSKAVYPCEKRGAHHASMPRRLPNAQAALALSQYARLDAFNARRRNIAARYDAELEGTMLVKPAQPLGFGHIFLRYTVQTEMAKALLQSAKAQGILLGDWYREPIAPRGTEYAAIGYQHGSCPVAERVSGLSLNLPTYPRLTEGEVTRVITWLNQQTQASH